MFAGFVDFERLMTEWTEGSCIGLLRRNGDWRLGHCLLAGTVC